MEILLFFINLLMEIFKVIINIFFLKEIFKFVKLVIFKLVIKLVIVKLVIKLVNYSSF